MTFTTQDYLQSVVLIIAVMASSWKLIRTVVQIEAKLDYLSSRVDGHQASDDRDHARVMADIGAIREHQLNQGNKDEG